MSLKFSLYFLECVIHQFLFLLKTEIIFGDPLIFFLLVVGSGMALFLILEIPNIINNNYSNNNKERKKEKNI
jgi:hypothetical protein